MTLPTYKFHQARQIGEAQALIERGRALLCTATGDSEMDGFLKDAWDDTLPEAIEALATEDEDEVRLIIENTCGASLRARQARLEGKDLFSIIKDICNPSLETLEAAE